MITSINDTIDLCNDFYKYACGNWPKEHLTKTNAEVQILTIRTSIRSDLFRTVQVCPGLSGFVRVCPGSGVKN